MKLNKVHVPDIERDGMDRRKTKPQLLKMHRAMLQDSIRLILLPAFIQQGFVITPVVNIGQYDRKFTDCFPLGFLRRARFDGGIDLVDIQFGAHRSASFRINVCAVPNEGMMTLCGYRRVEELYAGELHEHFEMYAFPRWWIFFSLPFWYCRTPVKHKYERLVLRVAGYLPEIELALRKGKLGPHMRRIMIPQINVMGHDSV